MLLSGGVDVVMRQHKNRPVDFRSGHRLGHDDHLVVWHKPQRASWMGAEAYAAIPETVTIRELRVRVAQRGFRTRVLIVMTTLLDAIEFSHDELAILYRARWHAEVCQADCTSRLSLYPSARSPHSGRGGVAGAGPVGPTTPATGPGATAMRSDTDRTVPPPPAPGQGRRVRLNRLWGELPAQARHDVLATLSRVVVQRLPTPPERPEVAHETP